MSDFSERIGKAYESLPGNTLSAEEREAMRQKFAGMLDSAEKQFSAPGPAVDKPVARPAQKRKRTFLTPEQKEQKQIEEFVLRNQQHFGVSDVLSIPAPGQNYGNAPSRIRSYVDSRIDTYNQANKGMGSKLMPFSFNYDALSPEDKKFVDSISDSAAGEKLDLPKAQKDFLRDARRGK